MSQMHYDVIIIGESLASRIAGALLAKNGLKVLSLQQENSTLPSWGFSSQTLERLLDQLDGNTCLSSPIHFQLLTDRTRLDINGKIPLEDEIKREFPANDTPIIDFLHHLKSLGEKIERMLWESGGIPVAGVGTHLKFFIAKFRNGFLRKKLSTPLYDLISSLGDQETLSAFRTLFTALTLAPIERISVAEAALLWSSVTRDRGVCSASLDELLKKRYQQFHGATEQLARIKSVETDGRSLSVINLNNGSSCTATAYLLGDIYGCRYLPKEISEKVPPIPTIQQMQTSSLGYKISPLLAERIISSQRAPFRLSLHGETNDLHALIETPCNEDTLELIEDAVARLFPFAPINLQSLPGNRPLETDGRISSRSPLTGFNRLKIARNLYLCEGQSAAPGCGTAGEIIVASTLVNALTQLKHHNNRNQIFDKKT